MLCWLQTCVSPLLIEVPIPKTIGSEPQAIRISLQIPRSVRLTARTSDSSTKQFKQSERGLHIAPCSNGCRQCAPHGHVLGQSGWRRGGGAALSDAKPDLSPRVNRSGSCSDMTPSAIEPAPFAGLASQNVVAKCHLGAIGFTISGFPHERRRDLMNGLRSRGSQLNDGVRV